MAEFTEIGQRCSAPLCNLKDFLPFDCDCCQQVFCLNHRSYASHECPLSGTKNMTAIVCPLCKSTIRLSDAQDANAEWERHARTSCSPEKAAKKARKRCNADGCREVLGLSNSHTCAQCHAAVCLTHRFAESHNCAVRRAAAHSGSRTIPAAFGWQQKEPSRAAPPAAAVSQPRQQANGSGGSRAVSQQQRQRQQQQQQRQQQQATAGNSVRETAARRRQQQGTAGGAAAIDLATGRGSERCPQCSASFSDVAQLIAHVEGAHASAHASAAPAAAQGALGALGGGTCPFCQRGFADAVELVSHVEGEHNGGAGLTATSTSTGGYDYGKCVMA